MLVQPNKRYTASVSSQNYPPPVERLFSKLQEPLHSPRLEAERLTISIELNSHTLCSWPLRKLPIRLQLYVTFNVCGEKLILWVFEFPQMHGDIIRQLSDKSRRSVHVVAGLLSFLLVCLLIRASAVWSGRNKMKFIKLPLWLHDDKLKSPEWQGTINLHPGSSYFSVVNRRLWFNWVALMCECVYMHKGEAGLCWKSLQVQTYLWLLKLPSRHPRELFTCCNITTIFSPGKESQTVFRLDWNCLKKNSNQQAVLWGRGRVKEGGWSVHRVLVL